MQKGATPVNLQMKGGSEERLTKEETLDLIAPGIPRCGGCVIRKGVIGDPLTCCRRSERWANARVVR